MRRFERPLRNRRAYATGRSAFTLVEVMVAAALVGLGLGGIYIIQAQSMEVVRAAFHSSSASQVLQQRIEGLRLSDFETVATSTGVVALMNGTAGGTNSEAEMTGIKNFRESVTISNFAPPGVTPEPPLQAFTVTRTNKIATASTNLSLATEPLLKVRLQVQWEDRKGVHQRAFSTVLSKLGINPVGVGREGSRSAGSPSGGGSDVSNPPGPTPNSCRHGRTWPHCGQT